MKRQSFTVGDRINKFDMLDQQTVGSFNNLFPECPVSGFDESQPLEILTPESNNSRLLNIAGLQVKHKMYSNLLYNVDKDGYDMDTESDDILGFPV